MDGIYDRYWGLPFNNSLPNTAIAVMGLLCSEGDFGLAIERAVMAGFDTNCTGATVGSVMGVLHGAELSPISSSTTTSRATTSRLTMSPWPMFTLDGLKHFECARSKQTAYPGPPSISGLTLIRSGWECPKTQNHSCTI